MTRIICIYLWFMAGMEVNTLLSGPNSRMVTILTIISIICEFGAALFIDHLPRKLTIKEHWARGRSLTVKLKNGVILHLTEE